MSEKVILEVFELATGKVTHELATTRSKSETVQMGMLRQMDLDRFSVREKKRPTKKDGEK